MGMKCASSESSHKPSILQTHKKEHQLPVPNIFGGKILNFASNDNDGTVLDTINVFKHTLCTLRVVCTV